MKKLKKMLSGILATVMSVSLLGAVPASADIAIPLEKTDVDGHDFYLCRVTYSTNDETGETFSHYSDIYHDFTSDFQGKYHQYYRAYEYVFVTISDDTVAEELDNVLGEQVDTVYYYGKADNQVVYDYSSEFDYKTLYDISGVENVELAKACCSGGFYRVLHDDPLKEAGIDPYDNNLLMSIITTDDGTELTAEMFDVTGYDVKLVSEGLEDNEWYVYYEYIDINSYVDFDNKAREIDGVLTSNVFLMYDESASENPFAFDTVLKELLGDINFDDTVDIYDAVEIAKSVMGIREFSESELILADFNNDSEVNIYDAIEISKTLMS
jgi:hypothetical protein